MPLPAARNAPDPVITSATKLFDTTALGHLPTNARHRYLTLTAQRDDARALADGARQKFEDARFDRTEARNILAQVEALDKEGKLNRAADTSRDGELIDQTITRDTKRLDDARERLAQADAAAKEAERVHKERAEYARTLSLLVERVERHIANLDGDASLADAPPLKKNDTLEGVREDIASALIERKRIEGAVIPREDAEYRASAFVNNRAEQVRISGLLSRGGPLTFPQTYVNAPPPGLSPVDLLCWAAPDLMIAALEREIDERMEGALSMSDDEQADALAQLDARIFELERKEAAIAERDSAPPRAEISVVAFLGIAH